MKSAALCIDKSTLQTRETGVVTDYIKQAILNRLKSLRHGELVIIDGDERHVFGRKDRIFPKSVTVTVTDPAFYTRVLMQGALGGGEA
ncbi:MAG TPA: hypothetical protein VM011_00250, partial [Gammaproteobacteria bacterium]|nr:hypothetical protein [Gammaproteobacteria bacterium]